MAPSSPPDERSRMPPSSSSGQSSRRFTSFPSSQSVRSTPYSTLGDALGSSSRSAHYGGHGGTEFPAANVAPINPVAPQVSPEGRYYYQSTGVPSAYDYSPYSTASYDTSQQQYGQTSLPPMRSASPAPHQSMSYASSPAGPYTHYSLPPQSSYAASSQQAQPWVEAEWQAHQAASFSPEPVQSQSYASRGEIPHTPPGDHRHYSGIHYSSAPLREEDTSNEAYYSSVARGKMRERPYDVPQGSAGYAESPAHPSPDIDFSKLSDTFRQVLQVYSDVSTSPLVGQGRPPEVSDIDRMLRSATEGLRMLKQPSGGNTATAGRRSSGDSSSSGERGNAPDMSTKRAGDTIANSDAHTCLSCGASSTPEWRRGPLGPRTLCNACGLVYAKLIKKRSREHGSNTMSSPSRTQVMAPPPPTIQEARKYGSPDDGDSEDGHSFGSQDAR